MNKLKTNVRWNEARGGALRRATARTHLRFVQTEIQIGRMSASAASSYADRRRYSAARRQIVIAKEAHKAAAKFIGRIEMDESSRERLRHELIELEQAIQLARSKIGALG